MLIFADILNNGCAIFKNTTKNRSLKAIMNPFDMIIRFSDTT